jgi:Flp pilus assembly protein TadB
MNINMLDDLLLIVRDRVSPITIIAAVVAAGGMTLLLVGLMSIRRLSLEEEAERISGIRRASLAERWQMRLNQSGLRIKLWEFVVIGVLIGGLLCAGLILLGFVAIGMLAIPLGPWLFYAVLMRKQRAAARTFREQLPDAIHDFMQYFAMHRDTVGAVNDMAVKGPVALRAEFAQVESLVRRKTPLAAALEAVGQSRPEPFFRQFMDALAQHESAGGDLRSVLERIARAQRSQLRLQDKIAAQQAGARFVGRVYAFAPLAFLVFMRAMGGETYARFYLTPQGQIMQVLVVCSGLAAWWMTSKIARRGLYLDGDTGAPKLDATVRQTGFQKPVTSL